MNQNTTSRNIMNQNTQASTRLFSKENRPFVILFLSLSIPTILEMCMSTILQYVDTAMVGHLGAEATAAVSLSTTYTWLFNSIFASLGMGFLSYISRGIGEGNTYKVRHASGMSFMVSIIMGALVTLFTMAYASRMPVWMGADPAVHYVGAWYFRIINMPLILRALQIILASVIRSTGDTRTPMKINIFMNILNILLNGVFIYFLRLGAIGAGIATAISYSIGALLMVYAFAKNQHVVLKKEYFMPEWMVLKDVMRIAIPTVLTNLVSCMGYIVATSFVSSMATVIFAAHSIAITAEEMFYIPSYGMQAATSTLIGNALGEGDRRKERAIMAIASKLIFLLMIVTGILLFLLAEPMMRLFTSDEQVVLIGARLLRLVAFSEPIFGLANVLDGIFIGLGRTELPLVVELIGRWGIRILGGYILLSFLGGGIYEFWSVIIADNIVRAALLLVCLLWIIRKEVQFEAQA